MDTTAISPGMRLVRLSLLLLGILLICQVPVRADNTGRCHCFKQRQYDPAHRFAADAYLLTTSFNSFLARSFGISKRQIVMLKMKGGIRPDDLLLALYLAREVGMDLNTVLSLRKLGEPWQDILAADPGVASCRAEPICGLLLKSGAQKETLDRIQRRLTAEYFLVPEELVANLTSQGLDGREAVLLLALGRYSTLPLDNLLDQYRHQGKSWSEIAHHLGFTPSRLGRLLLSSRDPSHQRPGEN